MPVYLLHGFRWPRPLIRIHIIIHNLDDAAAEWLMAPGTTETMIENFNEIHPDIMPHLKKLRFIEQYDPNDLTAGSGSQPHAYVADMVEEIKLGADVDEIRGKGVPSDQWAAMMELRDKLAPEEKVAWYIVVCGDEERWAPSVEEASRQEEEYMLPYRGRQNESGRRPSTSATVRKSVGAESRRRAASVDHEQQPQPQPGEPRGIKKIFSRRKSKSRTRGGDSPKSPKPPGGNVKQSPSNGVTVHTSDHNPASHAATTSNGDPVAQSAPSAPSATEGSHKTNASWQPNDDQEMITGPLPEDDALAAPSPTVRNGKPTEDSTRQKRRSKHPSYSTTPSIRPVDKSPALPHPSTFSPFPVPPTTKPTRYSYSVSNIQYHRSPSPHAISTNTPLSPQIYRQSNDQPSPYSSPNDSSASPTATPSGASTPMSFQTARQALSPRSSYAGSMLTAQQSLSPTMSRQSLLSQATRQNPQQHGFEAISPFSFEYVSSRASQRSVSDGTLTDREGGRDGGSVHGLGVEGAVHAVYGQHEKEWRGSRQSVAQEDLVARGLDDGVFAGLR